MVSVNNLSTTPSVRHKDIDKEYKHDARFYRNKSSDGGVVFTLVRHQTWESTQQMINIGNRRVTTRLHSTITCCPCDHLYECVSVFQTTLCPKKRPTLCQLCILPAPNINKIWQLKNRKSYLQNACNQASLKVPTVFTHSMLTLTNNFFIDSLFSSANNKQFPCSNCQKFALKTNFTQNMQQSSRYFFSGSQWWVHVLIRKEIVLENTFSKNK